MSPGPAAARSTREKLARLGWALLIAATLYVCYFSHLGAIGFVGPDEPRYAWVARAMVESGDWVTPHLYGQPWFEKPPLFYWGAALSFKLFGVSEAAARLPNAISALLATLALAWLAWRLYGAETARWLLLLLPTTVGMIGFSHAAATDMPFSAMLTMAMVCAAVAVGLLPHATHFIPSGEPASFVGSERGISLSPSGNSPQSTPWFALIAFGVFLGAAVLAKGPAGIVLCGGAVFFWALFTKRWRDAFRLLHPAAIAAFCLTALPWYILCARRNPDFLRVFLIEHNFQRYLTPEFHHIQPFWYFGPVILIALLPWVVWLVWYGSSSQNEKEQPSQSTAMTFVVAWGLFPLLFFSPSQSKLPGYILPSVPPLGCLIAVAASASVKNKNLWSRWILAVLGFLYAASATCVLYDLFTYRDRTQVHWTFYIGAFPILFFVVPAGMGGLGIISFAAWNRARSGLILAFLVFLFLVQVAGDYLPKLNPRLSVKVAESEISASDYGITYSFRMQPAWRYGLNFYLHREVPEWTPSVMGPAVVATSEANLKELRKSAEIVAVISDFWAQANIVRVRPLAGRILHRTNLR